ncbi:MAG TPA: zf-HC2 domain-containing protein [Aeromicrobium sp.]|nr:zf-HC2 domain-containing protein [Aeromicrobium sp.]
MAHLGEDVAAYVDGQLSPEAAHRADGHLERCERCRRSVVQQRALKDRMSGSGIPLVPPSLLASLDAVPTAPRRPQSFLPGAIGAVLVLVGASLAVVTAAYALAPTTRPGDPVTPPFDEFAATASSSGGPHGHLSVADMDQLDASGWPSQANLGAGFRRVDGHLHDHHEVVAQAYVGHGEAVMLFEQVGRLADDALTDFRNRVIAGRSVWVRDTDPRVVTWDADGMVYTLVTRLADAHLAPLLADLPAGPKPPTPLERIRDGLVRMSSWP